MKMRQHTVPRCYLQHFTDSEGFVWVLDVNNKIFKIRPENILLENHFYTITLKNGEKSLIVEDTLCNIEASYGAVYENKIKKKVLLTRDEKAKVAIFISAMIHRTKPTRESMRNMFAELKETTEKWKEDYKHLSPKSKRLLENTPRGSGKSISLEELEDTLENFDEEHSVSTLKQLGSTAQYIFDMKWAIISPENEKDSFVTSDNPCVMVRPESEMKYGHNSFGSRPGLIYEDVELTIPLSKDKLLLACWRLNQDSYTFCTTDIFNHLNQRSILNSSEKVVASSKENLDGIQKKYPPRSIDIK